MKNVNIGDIATITSGFAFQSNLFTDDATQMPLIRIRDVSGGHTKTYYSGEFSKEYIVKKGDLLISMDGEFRISDWKGEDALLNQRVCKIESRSNDLLNKYLHYLLPKKLKDIEGKTPFVTVKHLSVKKIKEIELTLPSIKDQKRIVELLDQADAFRKKRKQAVELLDNYLKSVFLKMFGDPVKNPKCWKRVPLSEILIKIESGRSPVCLDRSAVPGEWGVLKLGAVTKCIYNPSENKALPDIEKPNPNIEIRVGDILFSRKNTYELVAACAYVWETPPQLMMSDLIFRLVLRNKDAINPIFLQALMSFSSKRKMIQALAGGAAGSMPNISKTKLLEHKIEVPPYSLQNQFAEIVKQTTSLKQIMLTQSEEMENQFQALMQKAFNGAL